MSKIESNSQPKPLSQVYPKRYQMSKIESNSQQRIIFYLYV